MDGLFIPPGPSQNSHFPRLTAKCPDFTWLQPYPRNLDLSQGSRATQSPSASKHKAHNHLCGPTPKPHPPTGPSPRPLVLEASLDAGPPTSDLPTPEARTSSITRIHHLAPWPKSFGGSHCLARPSMTCPILPVQHQGLLPSNPALRFRQATLLKAGPDSHHELMPFPSQKYHRPSQSCPCHIESTKKCILKVGRSSSAPSLQKSP